MKTKRLAILLSLLLIGGCVVGDELTTLTIHPDGSADLVVFRSNLHSTEKGEHAQKELADYKANFEKHVRKEFARVLEAGGKIVDVSWIRDEVPFSNLVRVHFPHSKVLEQYGTVSSDDGSARITTTFHKDGAHRRLTVHIVTPPGKQQADKSPPETAAQVRQEHANAVSETRIAVADGFITDAKGFLIAKDKQSALLDHTQIGDAIRAGKGEAKFYLEWNVTP